MWQELILTFYKLDLYSLLVASAGSLIFIILQINLHIKIKMIKDSNEGEITWWNTYTHLWETR